MAGDKKTKSSTLKEVVTRDYTIHLHKHLHGCTFKKRAPKAIKVIREFARKQMNTTDVRLDPSVNGAVWANGIKSVPHRLRIRLARKRNEAEDAKEKLFTLISHVPMSNYKGVQTETFEE